MAAVHHVGKFPSPPPRGFIPFNMQHCRLQNGYPPHRHTYTELTVVQSGSGTHVVDGIRYPALAGEVFVIHPGVVHWFEDVCDFQHTNFYFDPDRFGPPRHVRRELGPVKHLLEPEHTGTSFFGTRLRLSQTVVPAVVRQIERVERELHRVELGRELMVHATFAGGAGGVGADGGMGGAL